MAQIYPLHEETDATPVAPILHGVSNDVVGYRIGGHTKGPEAIVIGNRAATATAFHKLAQLPSLPYLVGRLTLVYQEAIDDASSGVGYMDVVPNPVYGSLFVGYDPDEAASSTMRRRIDDDTYWATLRLCAKLGMISGRGVPAKGDTRESATIFEDMISPTCSLSRLSVLQQTVVDRIRGDQTKLSA